MAKKQKVGLYLGARFVGVALKEGKKDVFLGSAEASSFEDKEDDAVDENLHWQALIRKVLRQTHVEAKEVFLSLADRDFIVRPLELPMMSKAELESALIYGIEKDIPFKLGDLVWDYQYWRLPKEKKVKISFLGVRKSSLSRVKNILQETGLAATAIEPACLSLARMLKSIKKNGPVRDFALLDLTSQEAYLTFFQNDLPVFNRYLDIKEKEGGLDVESFIEAVNFSFLYFKREFKSCKLDKVFFLAFVSGLDKMAVSLREALSVEIEKVELKSLTSFSQPSIESLKALGSASRGDYPYRFNPSLKEVSKPKKIKAVAVKDIPWEKKKIIFAVTVVVFIYLAAAAFFNYSLSQKREEAKRVEEAFLEVDSLEGISWRDFDRIVESRRNEVEQLKKLKAEMVESFHLFELFGKKEIMPEAVWLDSMRVSKRDGRLRFEINAYAYKDDAYQERVLIDSFVENVKEAGLFESVSPPPTSGRAIEGFPVTQFSLVLD